MTNNLDAYTNQTVRVYFNLHKKCFSVQAKVNGNWKVIAHAYSVNLQNVVFKVSEAGRERVLKQQRKNVHAYVIGTLIENTTTLDTMTAVSYNPYKMGSFYEKSTGNPVTTATVAVLEGKAIMATL